MSPLNIVIIIIVLVLLYYLFKYFFIDKHTLQTMQNAQNSSTIDAKSLATNGTDVPSSNFTYSVWFYINNWNYRYGEKKVIFGRMGSPSSSGKKGNVRGLNGNDPCPAVVLDAVENNVSVSLACYPGPGSSSTKTEVYTCTIANVPVQAWVNLIVSVYGKSMDVYIDGKLVKTSLLPGIAAINNNSNVYVTPSGGFDGYTTKLQYFPKATNPQEAWNIYSQGYSDWLSSIFGAYKVQISLIENGNVQKSITI